MSKFRVVTPLAVVALGGLAYVAVSTSTSTAQAQLNLQGTDLKAKVERLEQQVGDLQKQVEQLKRRSVPLYTQPLTSPHGPMMVPAPQGEGDKTPPDWKSFHFQGRTYYMVPVKPSK